MQKIVKKYAKCMFLVNGEMIDVERMIDETGFRRRLVYIALARDINAVPYRTKDDALKAYEAEAEPIGNEKALDLIQSIALFYTTDNENTAIAPFYLYQSFAEERYFRTRRAAKMHRDETGLSNLELLKLERAKAMKRDE
jgi:hypothetical protein